MNIAVTLLQILVQYGPAAYTAAVNLWQHPAPTAADFLALLDSISQETYDAFIAAAQVIRTGTPVPVPAVATNTTIGAP